MFFVRIFCQLYFQTWAYYFVWITLCGHGVDFVVRKESWRIRFISFWGMPRVQVSIKCYQAHFITWLPSPTRRREWAKKADMYEGNVLVKKYRGGRQEDYLKKDFELFGIYLSTLVFILNSRFLCYSFKIIISLYNNLTLHFFWACILCLNNAKLSKL